MSRNERPTKTRQYPQLYLERLDHLTLHRSRETVLHPQCLLDGPRMEAGETLSAFRCREQRSGHGTFDAAGCQAIHVDAILGVVDGHLLGHADDLKW